ncbi:MAG: hypothetical protein AAF787_16220 [Chloroflexota bacterium]
MSFFKHSLLLTALLLIVLAGAALASPPEQQVGNVTAFTSAIRADLTLLVDTALPEGRPEDWTDNIDNTSPSYVPDLWYDKELLANEVFGEERRPPDWFGVTVDVADILARNVRHDLELIADQVFNDSRPPTWIGASPIYQCSRVIQNIYFLAVNNYTFTTGLTEDNFGYCTLIEAELRIFLLEDLQLELSGDELNEAILATRGDIERLANEAFGVNDRPQGWAGNTDINSPLLLSDNRADLDILADELLGASVRPDGWVGIFNADSRTDTWRNIRHDLEVLAEAVVPDFASIEGDRPRGWQNDDPLRICDIRLQDLVIVLEDLFTEEDASFSRFDFAGQDNYCDVVFRAANNFAESPPVSELEQLIASGNLVFEAEFAFAYLDLTALEYVGSMPLGTPFRAWYRNFNDSTMMFVSGEDFALYVDRRWTNMPQDVFDRLPTIEGVSPLTFCDATWCNGPGPTPTPTGGAIESLLAFETPVVEAPVDEEVGVPRDQKTQINFENVRIRYLQDNESDRTAEVTLELCRDATLIDCEPVIRVSDAATDEVIAPLRQQDGLNVYEFPYGYTANRILESATLISNDVFLSPPELPRN